MSETKTPRNIVILGAGFGGIACARELTSHGKPSGMNVIVIDRSAYHVFSPLLYEAATGFVEHENVGTAKLLRSGVAIPIAELLSPWGVDFIEDEIVSVDWDRREVLVGKCQPVRFDELVIALGAEVNFFGIPGMKEHSLVLKTTRDADRLRQRIHDCLHMKEKGSRPSLRIVVGGGGATGVELSAEISMFLRRHVVKGHLKPTDFHVTLVEASPRIIAAMNPAMSSCALARLKRLGVHVHLDTAMKQVMPGKVTLAPRACKPGETIDQLLCDFKHEGEKTMEADMVIWCGGIRGASTLERFGVTLDERSKRVPIDATFEVAGRTGAYAIGDSALLMDPKTKQPVPWLAQAAMVHGKMVARRIVAASKGLPLPVYGFPGYPVVVPLGGKFAAVAVGRWKGVGFIGWLVHEAATLRYFLSILPLSDAVSLWWRGLVMYSGND